MITVSTLHIPMLVVVGVLSGVVYARHLRARTPDFYVIASILVPVAGWIGVLLLNTTGLTPLFGRSAVDLPLAITVPYLLAYPLWFRAGGELAFICFGRHPDQGGLLWVFRLEDDTAEIDPSWNGESRNGNEE